MKIENMKDMDREQALNLKEELARSVLDMMVQQNFSETDMTEIQQSYLDGLGTLLDENNPVKQVGVFGLVVAGLDSSGELQGFIATGGTVGGLRALAKFFEASIQKTLYKEGACGCNNCYTKMLLGMAVGEMVPEKGGLEH